MADRNVAWGDTDIIRRVTDLDLVSELFPLASEALSGLLTTPILLIGALLVMVLIGVIIIVVIGSLIMLIPAFIVAGIVWFFTGSELLTGIAFLFVAVIAFARK